MTSLNRNGRILLAMRNQVRMEFPQLKDPEVALVGQILALAISLAAEENAEISLKLATMVHDYFCDGRNHDDVVEWLGQLLENSNFQGELNEH